MKTYKEVILSDIQETFKDFACQPILFVGSGLSRRYFGAPNWEGLLIELAKRCPEIKQPIAYYKQRKGELIDIGQEFANIYQEWAWGIGKRNFPDELFNADQPRDIYIKWSVSEILKALTPTSRDQITSPAMRHEVEALFQIQPHAIVTTNYDSFLELMFPDYEPIIGQQILRREYATIGEIFKIHGCVTKPETMILTRDDYERFGRTQKYISAKLVAQLSEHPVLFAGYSATDPNICNILADVDEILSPGGGLIENMYFLEWDEQFRDNADYSREKLLPVGEHRSIKVKSIRASNFDWVFEGFATRAPLENVNVKLLRALMARVHQLIRVDIPRQAVQVDYTTLQSALNATNDGLKLLGIAPLDSQTTINANYPYTLTEVAVKLGYRGWNQAQALIEQVRLDTGKDIKASDNPYHTAVARGNSKPLHKYSDRVIGLLTLAKQGKPYQVEGVP